MHAYSVHCNCAYGRGFVFLYFIPFKWESQEACHSLTISGFGAEWKTVVGSSDQRPHLVTKSKKWWKVHVWWWSLKLQVTGCLCSCSEFLQPDYKSLLSKFTTPYTADRQYTFQVIKKHNDASKQPTQWGSFTTCWKLSLDIAKNNFFHSSWPYI